MKLYGPKMPPYEVTEDDVLWLLRAVEAEGPIEPEVAATLINRFCFLRSHGSSRTLTDQVRAYAQPVNPEWFPNGSIFLKSLEGRSPEQRRLALQKAVERERTHSTRYEFHPHVERAVVAALNGFVAIPKNATDYAYPLLDATKKRMTALAPAIPGQNRLWVGADAATWQGYSVDPLVVKPWLLSLTNIRLEKAFDREFDAEINKVTQFFAKNASDNSSQSQLISLGKIQLDINEAANYSSVYSVALAQRSMNERLSSFARAKQMQRSRADHFEAGKIFNQANAEAWARQAANSRRITSASSSYPIVTDALGFDFATGMWTVTNGQKV